MVAETSVTARIVSATAALGALIPLAAFAEERPLSAIDWLSRSTLSEATYRAQPDASRHFMPPMANEPPIARGISLGTVSVHSLDAPSTNSLGLLPPSRTGLPADFWGATPEVDLARAVAKERFDTLPAIQGLLLKIILTELSPPKFASFEPRDALFLARIDALLTIGALDPALVMLEAAPDASPEIFRRRFDVALLLGEEERACDTLKALPLISPSLPARVFCMARTGDWENAVLTFASGRALEQMDPEMQELLERFLDAEYADGAEEMALPSHPSPLVFRLMEAIGQPLPTATLPLAFAQADLRSNTGWKARIEAGERLARVSIVDPNRLLGLYTENTRAPAGALWDRVRLIGALDRAIAAKDAEAVADLLPDTYGAMQTVELEHVLGALWGAELAKMDLPPEAAALAFQIAMSSGAYEPIARARQTSDPDERLLIGIAQGSTQGIPAQDQLGLMLKQAFDAPPQEVPPAYVPLLPDQLGLAILTAIDDITEGAKGDYTRVAAGLRLLRLVGLEDDARRTALELVVLERRG